MTDTSFFKFVRRANYIFGILLICSLPFALPSVGSAQSRESADRQQGSLNAGAEFSAFNPDVYCASNSPFSCGGGYPLIKGFGAFADYNIHERWGAEGEARWLHWDGVQGQVESTYLIGPRYRIYRWRRFGLWAKFLVGVGAITSQGYPGPDSLKGTLFVYAPGASLDYQLSRKFALRGDYEIQRWPSFAVLPPFTHGITPSGFSVGVIYKIR